MGALTVRILLWVPCSVKEAHHQYLTSTDMVTSTTQPYGATESWDWKGIWWGWVGRHCKEGGWIWDADATSATGRQAGSDGATWELWLG